MAGQPKSAPGFVFPRNMVVHHRGIVDGEPYPYAIGELRRLLGRLGMTVESAQDLADGGRWRLALTVGRAKPADMVPDGQLAGDAYCLDVSSRAIDICSLTQKGVLNGVYDMAERLGFLFLLPGEDGEWPPAAGDAHSLPSGSWTMRPRFAHHGVFSGMWLDFGQAEWLRFFAKLRFNATNADIEYLPLCRELGLRAEVGGHGLSSLLPREQFAEAPERFRMAQPEDFNGKRTPDANLCAGNLGTWEIVQKNFMAHLETARGAYAVHAWADDLPAGGWCLCPLCRSLEPSDQAMLAMRRLAEAAARTENPPRIAVIAYHDTIRPGAQIDAPREGFLLFAPRERCYAHALDDASCPRNRFYLEALDAWIGKFSGIDDAHTFEYYFDQVLFRGMHPFLPGVILEDMRVYRSRGIECHMSLQVAGPAIAPEFNMLVFVKGAWDAGMTAETAIQAIACQLGSGSVAAEGWGRYLRERSRLYADAMRFCGHAQQHLDYRWLPETTHPFGEEMAAAYARCAEALDVAADELGKAYSEDASRVGALARRECGRAHFEAAELRVMHHQQRAMNGLGRFLNSAAEQDLSCGVEALETACQALETALDMARAAGLSEKSWYVGNVNAWLRREFMAKAANYRRSAPDQPGQRPTAGPARVTP